MLLDLLAAVPVAGFETAKEFKGTATNAGIADKGRLHGGGNGKAIEDAIERGFEEHVEKGEDAEQVELGRIGGQRRSKEFAELRAGEGEGDERG